MNAVLSLTPDAPPSDAPPPQDHPAEAAPVREIAVAVEAPAMAPLDEAVIARAIADAARTGRSTIDILKETSGRAPADLAHALAAALDYRFVGQGEKPEKSPCSLCRLVRLTRTDLLDGFNRHTERLPGQINNFRHAFTM